MFRNSIMRCCNVAGKAAAAAATTAAPTTSGVYMNATAKPAPVAAATEKPTPTMTTTAAKNASTASVQKVETKTTSHTQQVVAANQPSKYRKTMDVVWEGLRHVYHGFRLFFINTRLAWKYSRQLKRGVALTRRERLLLEGSTRDLLRLVPFSFFIIVPFAEFLLPVALKMFPGLIPSTFETDTQGRNRAYGDAMKTLRARQRVMEYESAIALATFEKDAQEVIRRNAIGDAITPEDIRLVAPSFNNEGPFSVYKIPDNVAVSLARSAGVFKWYHSLAPAVVSSRFLRRAILRRYHMVREDDRLLRVEGFDNLTDDELIKANQTRGMRWTENTDTLRVQLEWWNLLARDPNVPYNTLFWIKPTRYSLRKSMNSIPVEQRRQMLGIQNLPESIRSSLETLCDTVGAVPKISDTPDTVDSIVAKISDITNSAKKGDKDLQGVDTIGAYLTEENVKAMYEKLRKTKLADEEVLVSDVIEAVGHETHNSSHVVSTLFDAFDYGAGSKPITEKALVAIGARCRAAVKVTENKAEAAAAATTTDTSKSTNDAAKGEKATTGAEGKK